MARLDGVAIVTGGTGGLGQAVVAELLDGGAQVVTTWLVEAERESIEGALGEREGLTLVEANLLEDGAEVAVKAAAELGPVSSLVNLVGGFAAGPRLHEADPGELEKMLALNLTTAVNTSRAAIPVMLEGDGGAIVCVGTKVAFQPFSGGVGLRDLEVRGAGPGPLARRRVPRGRHPRQRDRPQHHRYPGQSRVDARRGLLQVGAARRDRSGDPLPLLGRLLAGHGRGDTGLRPDRLRG